MEQKVRREVQEVRWVRSGSDVGVRSRDRARDVTLVLILCYNIYLLQRQVYTSTVCTTDAEFKGVDINTMGRDLGREEAALLVY